MLFKLLLLFTIVPLMELALLLQVGRWIGVWPTVGIVLATAFAGSVLAKWAGSSVLARIRNELAAGRIPSDELVDGALILVGGALLITPGLLTDLTGLSLLLGPTRAIWREQIKAAARRKVHFVGPRTDNDVREVKVEVKNTEPGDRNV